MRILPSLFTLALASTVVTGCTTKKYYEIADGGGTGDGGSTGAPASVSFASPNTAFLGRTLDVTISGSDTSWSSATTVSFGDKVTVNKLTVASASALVANITVDPAATVGARDITVTDGSNTEKYSGAFSVTPSISVTAAGTLQQGSIVVLTIKNLDTNNNPFDTTGQTDPLTGETTFTNIAITGPTGTEFVIENVTQNEVDALMAVDLSTAAGSVDLDLMSGPQGGTTVDFTYPAALTLAAQTPATLTNNTTATLTAPYASIMYKYTPTGATDLVTFGVSDTNSSSTLYLLDKTGSFQNIINSGTTIDYEPTSTDPVYVLAFDGAGDGMVSATVTVADVALTTVAAGTGNQTAAHAMSVGTPPVEVTGAQLTSQTDVDWYKVVVQSGQTIHVITTPGDAMTDTTIDVFDATGTTEVPDTDGSTQPVDNSYQEDDSFGPVTATATYTIQVAYSSQSQYDSTESHYNLIVTLE